jgi:hypothetical protein
MLINSLQGTHRDSMLEEWAYIRPNESEAECVGVFGFILHLYIHLRSHPALGGKPPIKRVNNLAGP